MTATHATIGPEPINKSDAFCAFSEPSGTVRVVLDSNIENNPHGIAFLSSRPFCIIGKLISFDLDVAAQINQRKKELKPDDFTKYLEDLFHSAEGTSFNVTTGNQ